jgi:hypothetical protein
MAQRYAPFIQSFWNSPEVLKIVSDIAGVDLVPAMNYEICHTNIQLGDDGLDGVRATPIIPPKVSLADTTENGKEVTDNADAGYDSAIVKWHKDSHPFVCVVMLSDARNMEGGETVLMGGDGKKMKVRAPQMVSCPYSQQSLAFTIDIKSNTIWNTGQRSSPSRTIHFPRCSPSNQYARANHHRHIIPAPRSNNGR